MRSVVAGLAWPSWRLMKTMSSPCAISRLAKVWRQSASIPQWSRFRRMVVSRGNWRPQAEATDLPPTSLGRELVAVIQADRSPRGARDEELQGGIGWHKIPANRDGSDGTRTRDLRRDRQVPESRRLTTTDAQSLYSCDFSGFPRSDFAWLSEADFRRLLPGCCPKPCFADPGYAASEPSRVESDRSPRVTSYLRG
jgi:hypothetical protein